MSVTPANVAMFCEGTEVYGIGTIQKLYAEHMPGMLFVCVRDGPMLEWLRAHGHRVIHAPVIGSVVAGGSGSFVMRLPGLLRRAARDARSLDLILRREGITWVHTHWLPQQLLGSTFRQLGYRVAWQINNLTNPRRLFGMGLTLNHMLARRGADLLLPASDFIANFWRGSGVPCKTIRNAATVVHDAPGTPPPGPVRCLIAGRLDPTKGHHLALEAIIVARQAGFDVTLDIFGGPLEANPYADQLRERARVAGIADAVRLHGYVDDLRQRHVTFHLGMQCRVDPEPCSLWVCETLVDGLPLLAADNGGTPELVRDGETGLLFRSGDSEDLAVKLIEALKDPPRLAQMRSAAFARGRAHFTIDRFIRETLEAYRSMDSR